MRLLLGSGGFRTEERRARLVDAMRAHFGGAGRVLFVPYALADHDGYARLIHEAGFDAGIEHVGVHTFDDPAEALRQAEAISVGGGNTFRLVDALHRLGLIEPIRERVRAGVPFMGVSAGTNVACPTLCTTNDMPIVQPPSFETTGLVPFQINPHYFAGSTWLREGEGYQEHFGETRDDRIREYHEMNERPVLGLWEGGFLLVEDDAAVLHGAPARLFHPGEEPVDLAPGARLAIEPSRLREASS